MLVVAKLGRWLLQLFEEFLTLCTGDLGWSARSGSVVRSLLDRLFFEPIEPVLNRSRNNTVTISQRINLIALLAANRRENIMR